MATITKKELIDRIAERTQAKRVTVKSIIQAFLDEIVRELNAIKAIGQETIAFIVGGIKNLIIRD